MNAGGRVSGSGWRKSANLCYATVSELSRRNAGRVGELTLTFANPEPSAREALKRWDHFRVWLGREGFGDWVRVIEAGDSTNRLHLHVAIVCPEWVGSWGPCRDGKVRARRSTWARGMFARLRRVLPAYGFGERVSLSPIKCGEAFGNYLAGYIVQSMRVPVAKLKGARLWGCSHGARVGNQRCGLVGPRSWVTRKRIEAWFRSCGFKDLDEVRAACGPGWYWNHRVAIESTPLPVETVYPTVWHAVAAGAVGADEARGELKGATELSGLWDGVMRARVARRWEVATALWNDAERRAPELTAAVDVSEGNGARRDVVVEAAELRRRDVVERARVERQECAAAECVPEVARALSVFGGRVVGVEKGGGCG